MNTERIVIVGYKPFIGKEHELLGLLKTHVEELRKEGLASERKPVIVKANDGTFIEVFGWKSKDAIASAHTNPTVQRMWEEFAKVCEYIPISDLPEAKQLFSEFSPVSS